MIRKDNQDAVEPKLRWRVFCAVALPEELCARVRNHIARLRTLVPDAQASWSRDHNIHLTLKFLGQIPVSRVEALSSATQRATEGFSSFEISIEQSGAFPERGLPRVLWLGVSDKSGKLAELQARLEDECGKDGFAREQRPFHPHLTLTRVRKPHGARALAAAHKEMFFQPTEVLVSEVLVIRSELDSEGSNYAVISSHRIGNASG